MDTAVVSPPRSSRRLGVAPRLNRRLFYTVLPLAMFLSVLVGFAPSYYLKTLYGTRELSLLYHIHGVAFTGWMLLIIVQLALVATRRTPLHRRDRSGWRYARRADQQRPRAPAATGPREARREGPPTIQLLAFMTATFATVLRVSQARHPPSWSRAFPATHKRLRFDRHDGAVGARCRTLARGQAGSARWGFRRYRSGTRRAARARPCDPPAVPPCHGVGRGAAVGRVTGQRMLIGGTTTWLSFAGWLTS